MVCCTTAEPCKTILDKTILCDMLVLTVILIPMAELCKAILSKTFFCVILILTIILIAMAELGKTSLCDITDMLLLTIILSKGRHCKRKLMVSSMMYTCSPAQLSLSKYWII